MMPALVRYRLPTPCLWSQRQTLSGMTALVGVATLVGTLALGGTICVADQDKQALTLESIFAGSDFNNNLPQNIQWHNNGLRFTFTRKNPESGLLDIHEHDVAGGKDAFNLPGRHAPATRVNRSG